MSITPLYTLIIVALLLALIAVAFTTMTALRLRSLQHQQSAISHRIEHQQRDFEKEHHLTTAPPVDTVVMLITDSTYLREYHGARPGQIGTVIQHSRLNHDDTGVLVNWGVRPNDCVRMELDELRPAPSTASRRTARPFPWRNPADHGLFASRDRREPQLVVVTCAGNPGPDGKVLNYDQNTIISGTLVTL